jgi:hypothetical protein
MPRTKPNPIRKYRVLKSVWSRQHNQYFEPGDVVEWNMEGDNAPGATTLETLEVSGAIEVYTEPAPEIVTQPEEAPHD